MKAAGPALQRRCFSAGQRKDVLSGERPRLLWVSVAINVRQAEHPVSGRHRELLSQRDDLTAEELGELAKSMAGELRQA